jgi:hypothetical protein
MNTQSIIQAIKDVLSFIFPFRDVNNNRNSIFIQQTWLEKNSSEPYVKDYLWTPPYQAPK